MSRLLSSARQIALSTKILTRKHVPITLPKSHLSSGAYTSKNDFRQLGAEKDAGALQDLLRRVMEIDAEITNTPVVDFKPNAQHCVAYCTADMYDIPYIINKLSKSPDFHVTSGHTSNMIHILDQTHGGEIYLFHNGTLVCWGLNELQREIFLNGHIRAASNVIESKENIEYIIDEDELTDMKGDMILLNPYIPTIDLSKVAFSYGLGRAAKVASFESTMDNYLSQLNTDIEELSKKHLKTQLIFIRRRMLQGSNDGFLGTPDFHWIKPELQDYVKKISNRFDIHARIQILNKKIEYATEIVNIL